MRWSGIHDALHLNGRRLSKRLFDMKTNHYATISLLCLLLLPGGALPILHAQDVPVPGARTIQVIGTAPILSADVEKARDAAVANGLVLAVGQAAAELLTHEGLVKYFQELNQTLFNNTQAYIQNYKVSAESMTNNVYRIVLEATVSTDVLEKYLSGAGFIHGQKALPKILFLISEKMTTDASPRFWWGSQDSIFFTAHCEAAMIKTMDESGFTIVSHQNPKIISDLPSMGQKYQLSDEDAVFVGVNTSADVLVVGEALVETAQNVMETDKRSFKATLSVRAIRSDTGEQIAQTRQTAVTVDADETKAGAEALTQAGKAAGNEIAAQLALSWQAGAAAPGQIAVVVEGTSDLASFVFFRKSLNELPGVKSIFIREMKSDQADILVDYEGSAEQLAETLMTNTYGSFGINIYEITPEMLKVKLVKK
jgi:hypothetical protein